MPSIRTTSGFALVCALAGGCGGVGSAVPQESPNAFASGGARPAETAPASSAESAPASSSEAVSNAQAPAATAMSGGSGVAPMASVGFDAEHPVLRCGARDSYQYVAAEYQCPDGSNPLNGDLSLGQRSRRGNVGANSTGHIIDLYVVPCASGPQQVYVDMYGCNNAP